MVRERALVLKSVPKQGGSSNLIFHSIIAHIYWVLNIDHVCINSFNFHDKPLIYLLFKPPFYRGKTKVQSVVPHHTVNR